MFSKLVASFKNVFQPSQKKYCTMPMRVIDKDKLLEYRGGYVYDSCLDKNVNRWLVP